MNQKTQEQIYKEKFSRWQSAAERIKNSDVLKPELPVAYYGIEYLDLATSGIFKDDVVLVSAKTGIGKTELVSTIAENLSKAGVRVNLIALEASYGEIERRIFYRHYSSKLMQNETFKRTMGLATFDRFCRGKIHIPELYDETMKEMMPYLKNLYTSYRTGTEVFDFDRLKSHIYSSAAGMNAVILDHLHFVDMKENNENLEMRKIIQELRNINMLTGTPIIVVAHMRKNMMVKKSLIPDLEDVHGSSDLIKTVTKAILISPARDQEKMEPHLFPTYFHVAKNRQNGSVSRYVGLMHYNVQTNSYEDSFEIGTMSFDGSSFQPIIGEQNMPSFIHGDGDYGTKSRTKYRI